MERICLHPKETLKDLVHYALWLLECSHESSRNQATMFFSVSFSYRVILELFDAQDGLRKLLNVIFMLDLFKENDDSNDDELYTKRSTAKLIVNALKKYFEAHLIVECEQLRRSQLIKNSNSNQNNSNQTSSSLSTLNSKTNQFNYNKLTIGNVPPYKAMKYTNETIIEFVETLLEIMPIRKSWKPVESLINLGGVKLIVNLIVASADWIYNSKSETLKSALDILVVCSALPKMQVVLTECIQIELDRTADLNIGESTTATPIQVLIDCSIKLKEDPEVQCSALQVLINCCCGPLNRIGSTSTKLFHNASNNNQQNNQNLASISGFSMSNQPKNVKKIKTGEDLLNRLWYSVRSSNGIMVLLNLLTTKTPITHADKIRLLACKVLCGLARSETIKQILVKLTIFTSGHLQQLMKEPILQERLQEHTQFKKYSLMLIQQVTGSNISNSLESTSTANLSKAEIVAQTKITYNEKELLSLIYSHLKQKGLDKAAETLLKEVKESQASTNRALDWPSSTPNKNVGSMFSKRNKKPRMNLINDCTTSPSVDKSKLSNSFQLKLAKDNRSNSPSLSNNNHTNSPLSSLTHTKGTFHFPSTGITPIKLNKLQSSNRNSLELSTEPNISKVTLDGIVTEYLRKQHSQCKLPVYTCPPFDLFKPHNCPEPLYKNRAPMNCALRVARKEIIPNGGLDGRKWDRQLIYSKFKSFKTYKDPESMFYYSCCSFSHVNQFFFLGTSTGELNVFNLYSSSLEASYNCHTNSMITHVEPSKDGNSIITSSFWPNLSVLWTFTDIFEMRLSFEECGYAEFSKNSQDKVIGTSQFKASLYDLNTNQLLNTFESSDLTNRYTKNRATFDYTDELVLNDGILWDVRSASLIHKFDKFNDHINGVFHPNNREVIANAQIWDLVIE